MKLLVVFIGLLAAVAGWDIFSPYLSTTSLDGSYVWSSYNLNPIQINSYLSYPSYEHYIIARSAPKEETKVLKEETNAAPLRKRRSVVLEDENVRKARWEHEQAHLRVLSGLPAIPEGGFIFPYPEDTQEVNDAKARFLTEYGLAVQRNLAQSPHYSGLPMEAPEVLTARATHAQAHRDALARLSGTYTPAPYQVYNTQEVRVVSALNDLAQQAWKQK